MKTVSQEKEAADIIDRIDPRVLERIPFRALLIMIVDALAMDPKCMGLKMVARKCPEYKDEANGLYAERASMCVISAWSMVFKAGLIDEDVPADLRKIIEP
jgi:hypothetical protein